MLLSQHGLASPLLARFDNGLLYRYVTGYVCSVEDLAAPQTWKAVARLLGEWHGILPKRPAIFGQNEQYGKKPPADNLWGVLHKWILALPSSTDVQKAQAEELRRELTLLEERKENGGYGLKGHDGGMGLITGHCDLLHGNVIILPGEPGSERKVHFIDYEYSTACERAFDIANHFSEWGGFQCDYERLPNRGIRHEFIHMYLQSFHQHRKDNIQVTDEEVENLMSEVDLFRGLPGFYWGIWALIQAMISKIDFDYASYAVVRLSEYYAWKNSEQTEREKRWAAE